MQQKKRTPRKLLSQLLILTLLLATALFNMPSKVKAATSFDSIRDTISNSDVSAPSVTHTVIASTSLAVDASGYLEIVFPAEFSNVSSGNLSCPNSGVAGGSGNTLTCTYSSSVEATSSTLVITGVTNPSTVGSYGFHVYNKQNGGAIKEQASFQVAIVNHVTVNASVESTLTFSIQGIATSTDINGVTTTGSSTFSTLNFGVVTPGAVKTLGQSLHVGTNATYGYTVTVAQNHNLLSSGGADIDAFNNGVAATTTALAWAAPSGVLGQENTYGHFGLTSRDSSLSDGDAYGAALFKGLKNSDPVEVMYHNGPSDGTTVNIGSTSIAYSIEVNPLQESGDYSNILTYVCTPTY